MVLYIYAVTLFVSAFTLFLVQPLIGKMILPKLGGTPQVWNTCMVFYQMTLLAGYAYSHFISSNLKLRQQIIVHCVMLFLPLIVLFGLPTNFFNLYLPVVPEHPGDPVGWNPGNLGGNPIVATLAVLTMVIGLPFLVVSTTAPLLQKWFAYTGHPAAKDPYFLYGASNLGSMLGLIGYIVVIEPQTNLSTQTWIWAAGYFTLIGTVLWCVGLVWAPSARFEMHPHLEHARVAAAEPALAATAQAATAVTAGPPPAGPSSSKATAIRPPGKRSARRTERAAPRRGHAVDHRPTARIDEIDGWRRLRWVALAAVPSSLMLGITTHITTDLSPIPLFWVIPLALYLLTFILVFSRWPLNWIEHAHPIVLYIQPVLICLMLFSDMLPTTQIGVVATIGFNMAGFFFTTLVCHGELAKDRPSTRHLTEFYLWMSVGGVVGGMFNALVAPVIFNTLIELSIAIFAACLLRPRLKDSGWIDDLVAGLLEPAAETPAHRPGGKQARPHAAPRATATAQMTGAFDVMLPIGVGLLVLVLAYPLYDTLASIASAKRGMNTYQTFLTFGVPLLLCCLFYNRPWRFGLGVGAVMLAHWMYTSASDRAAYTAQLFRDHRR